MSKLAVLVLGENSSGKSNVWYSLFGGNVKTGKRSRPLELGAGGSDQVLLVNGQKTVQVFLINASPEESGVSAKSRLGVLKPDVVLCSVQYVREGRKTIDFFHGRGYEVSAFWLNPGFSDKRTYFDYEGLAQYLMHLGADVRMRSGGESARIAREVRERVFGWASYHL